MSLLDEVTARVAGLDPKIRAALTKQVMDATGGKKWISSPGPQSDAYYSKADLLLYGGQAGGGKSALITGLALMEHKRTLILRRQYTDIKALIEDTLQQNGTRDGFNGSAPATLRTKDGRLIDFGGAKDPGDEEHYKGQPHDLLCLDEASQFLESQFRFLSGWVRSTDKKQRTRIVLCTNPPEKPAVGRWLFEKFAPFLDKSHPRYPVPEGELLWYVSDEEGHDRLVDGPEKVEVGGRLVTPQSRTFISAALSDNPFLEGTGYEAGLDSLPEPLRSAVRDGNWMISHEDDAWQLIPTNWVLAAQERWTPQPPMGAPMCCIGGDVAQGGAAETVLAPRFDAYFANLIATPGRDTPTGSDVAALVLKHRRNGATVVLDMGGGYGGAAKERLEENGIAVVGFKGAEGSGARTKDRQFGFINKRAETYWRFREALDPDQQGGSPVALPPDPKLFRDLVTPRYEITPRGIKIESKDDIATRIGGESTDRGDAVTMAWSVGATTQTHGQRWRNAIKNFQRPKTFRGHEAKRRR
ncbi:MAG TPA: terminase [Marinobacter sp.]|uniref:Phage terminase large subunit N-terminal domain-containing protein n=1 Tax=marine sediment metagenome TaxID=412755 RepID=A0A0F9S250_9ZZZZ|nr:terminase [Marinobacter sp.]